MPKAKRDVNGGLAAVDEPLDAPETEAIEPETEDRSAVVATVATVAVVGIGAAAFEAALLPGIVLGVAAMFVPKYLPQLGAAVNPLFRSTVRGAYKIGQKTKEMVAEAQEQVHDIVAEVHAEGDLDTTEPEERRRCRTATPERGCGRGRCGVVAGTLRADLGFVARRCRGGVAMIFS